MMIRPQFWTVRKQGSVIKYYTENPQRGFSSVFGLLSLSRGLRLSSPGLLDLFRGDTGLLDLLSGLSLFTPSFLGERERGERGDLGSWDLLGGVLEYRLGGLREYFLGGDLLEPNLTSEEEGLGPPFLSSPTSQSKRNLRPSKLYPWNLSKASSASLRSSYSTKAYPLLCPVLLLIPTIIVLNLPHLSKYSAVSFSRKW